MFALHGSVRLKRDILDTLENTNEYLSIKQITEILGYPSLNSVKQACTELKQQFEQLYSKEEAEFVVKVSEGVKLIRQSVNSQPLVEELFINDLIYPLLSNLLINRTISMNLFLEENYISRSTLYNRIRSLNKILNPYGLHISLASRITLKGEEHQLRMFAYLFFFVCHRMIQFIPAITLSEQLEMEELTADIFDYLAIPLSKNQKQKLAIFTHINNNGAKHTPLSKNSLFQSISTIRYPEKPAFLSHWSLADWQFYVSFLYVYNAVDSTYDHQLLTKTDIVYKEDIGTWLALFEKYVSPLDQEQKNLAQLLLDKHLIFIKNLPLEKNFLDNFKGINEKALQQQFPEFTTGFQHFWKKLVEEKSIYQDAEYVRRMSLITAIKLIRFEDMIPTLKIYVFTDISELHKNHFQARLKNSLSGYTLVFVENHQEADLIISTITFLEELKEQQRALHVRSSFTILDMMLVEEAARQITHSKQKT